MGIKMITINDKKSKQLRIPKLFLIIGVSVLLYLFAQGVMKKTDQISNNEAILPSQNSQGSSTQTSESNGTANENAGSIEGGLLGGQLSEILTNGQVTFEQPSNAATASVARSREAVPPELLMDSIVVRDSDASLDNFPNAESLGTFKYILDGKEAEQILGGRSSDSEQILKLVHFENRNEYMITDGGLIVTFNGTVDRVVFADEYNLQVKYDFSTAAAYDSTGFVGLNNFMQNIDSDPRTSKVELNLIDPKVVPQ
tara:strand:+ start:304 stop:1071 length:768 start_codon:yes stop_codon:yes gene_type:complete